MRPFLSLLLTAPLLCAQDRSQARSMVISDHGIVATSQTLASQAGAQVLARGGSAMDAAIAANADEKESLNRLLADRNGKVVFTRNGKAPIAGEIFRNPQLAGAYKLIAAERAPAFYRGAIARALLKTSDRLGGKMALADLSEF